MKKKLYIKNFTTLTSYEGGQRYKVVRDENGEELGIEVSGVLTTFDVPNENGTEFTRESYDKFVDEYFIAHSVNVPLVLYHNDTDPRTVAGIVKSMTKTDLTLNGIVGVRMSWNVGALYTKKNNLDKLATAQNQIAVQRDVFLFNTSMKTMQ